MVVVPPIQNVAVISVRTKGVTLQMLSDELKEWGLEGWDWQIQQLSALEFGTISPSKDSLRMVASCTSFILPINSW